MIQIRSNCFETNSSSTHTIAIPREATTLPSHVFFNFGEFGWAFEEVSPLDYLYTAIMEIDPVGEQGFLDTLKDYLDSHNITYDFAKPSYEEEDDEEGHYSYMISGYIDHVEDLYDFISSLLSNPDELGRYIAGGRVITGNDNCTEEQYKWMENYFDSSYEKYYKGN